jgi:hypothetical protein
MKSHESRIGYVEYDRRLHGDACLVHLRKNLARTGDRLAIGADG